MYSCHSSSTAPMKVLAGRLSDADIVALEDGMGLIFAGIRSSERYRENQSLFLESESESEEDDEYESTREE